MVIENSERYPEKIDTKFVASWNGKTHKAVSRKINFLWESAQILVEEHTWIIKSLKDDVENILNRSYAMYRKNTSSESESNFFYIDPLSKCLLPDYSQCKTLKEFLEKMIQIRWLTHEIVYWK